MMSAMVVVFGCPSYSHSKTLLLHTLHGKSKLALIRNLP